MSYLDPVFTQNIKKPIKTILELGSRDLEDAKKLVEFYDADIYSFECNPDCLDLCYKNFAVFDPSISSRITIVPHAVCVSDDIVPFFPFDPTQYNNIGASSMLKIDFNRRSSDDPDFGRPNPQKMVSVSGIRMDTFCKDNFIEKIDLVCIDLQGYELEALKSFGECLRNVHYIITEASINSTYEGGANFNDLRSHLESFGFKFICHNKPIRDYHLMQIHGFSEFDCLFENPHFSL
jgi:FkbM family methyltransferase